MGPEDPRARATDLWEQAYSVQMRGDLEEAEDLYRKSIELWPTAEAHTYLGWSMSWRGDVDGAIGECRKAIEVDPDFGNPYNDIGAYLIQKGELDEAIPWLEKAQEARRYEPRHFPHLNLGRIFAHKGQIARAIQEFQKALDLVPRDARARRAVDHLRSMLN